MQNNSQSGSGAKSGASSEAESRSGLSDAPRVNRRPESVLVIVYTSDGWVLLLQRADDPDFWQSVTGSLELDEQPLEAAHRELREETGLVVPGIIDCQSSHLFEIRGKWRRRYADNVTHNREHVFLAPLESRCEIELEPREHLSCQWTSVADALRILWSPSNRTALEQFVVPRLEN